MEFIETTKGKVSLVFEGFCYRKRRANKDNSVVWQCIHEKNKGCKGKVVSLNDQVTSVTQHACVPKPPWMCALQSPKPGKEPEKM